MVHRPGHVHTTRVARVLPADVPTTERGLGALALTPGVDNAAEAMTTNAITSYHEVAMTSANAMMIAVAGRAATADPVTPAAGTVASSSAAAGTASSSAAAGTVASSSAAAGTASSSAAAGTVASSTAAAGTGASSTLAAGIALTGTVASASLAADDTPDLASGVAADAATAGTSPAATVTRDERVPWTATSTRPAPCSFSDPHGPRCACLEDMGSLDTLNSRSSLVSLDYDAASSDVASSDEPASCTSLACSDTSRTSLDHVAGILGVGDDILARLPVAARVRLRCLSRTLRFAVDESLRAETALYGEDLRKWGKGGPELSARGKVGDEEEDGVEADGGDGGGQGGVEGSDHGSDDHGEDGGKDEDEDEDWEWDVPDLNPRGNQSVLAPTPVAIGGAAARSYAGAGGGEPSRRDDNSAAEHHPPRDAPCRRPPPAGQLALSGASTAPAPVGLTGRRHCLNQGMACSGDGGFASNGPGTLGGRYPATCSRGEALAWLAAKCTRLAVVTSMPRGWSASTEEIQDMPLLGGPGFREYGPLWVADDTSVAALASACASLRYLDVRRSPGVTDVAISRLARACPQLEHVNVAGARVSDRSVRLLCQRCPRLRHLCLAGCGDDIGDNSVSALAARCPLVEHLDVSGCARVGHASLAKLGSACPKLRHLNISGCSLSDATLLALARGCQQLQLLDISDCKSGVTDVGVSAISRGCPRLRHLNLRLCRGVRGESLGIIGQNNPDLVFLDVGGLSHLPDEAFRAIAAGCPALHSLGLACCEGLSDATLGEIARGCPRLRHLVISYCRGVGPGAIRALGDGCRELRTLHVEYCEKVTNESIVMLMDKCDQLQLLRWRHVMRECSGQRDVAW